MKNNVGIIDSLVFQFDAALDDLKRTIRAVPGDQWKTGDAPHLVPVRQACHIIGACDMHSSRKFSWGRRFGKPVGRFHQRLAPEDLPDKSDAILYLEKVRAQVHEWLREMNEQGLKKRRKTKRKRFNSNLGFVLYALRHLVLHLGYLRWELKRRGITYPEFR